MSCSTRGYDLSARWAVWLTENFHSNQQIERAFNVSPRTVAYWLSQDAEPRGRHLAQAVRDYPECVPALFGDRA